MVSVRPQRPVEARAQPRGANSGSLVRATSIFAGAKRAQAAPPLPDRCHQCPTGKLDRRPRGRWTASSSASPKTRHAPPSWRRRSCLRSQSRRNWPRSWRGCRQRRSAQTCHRHICHHVSQRFSRGKNPSALWLKPFWLKPFSLKLFVFVDTGLGVWFVVCAVAIPATVFLLCVAVAIPATVFLLCLCGPCHSCSRKISGQEWSAIVSKRREGARGRSGRVNVLL